MAQTEGLGRAVELAREGNFKDALATFERDRSTETNPTAMSYYGLSLAIVKEDYAEGVAICLRAVKRDVYSADIYLNLGNVLLLKGQKPLAIKAFKKGLSMDHKHRGLIRAIKKLGIRKRPTIPMLDRDNPVNKYLGKISTGLG